VKNVNSFRFIRQALEYEIERQAEVLDAGGKIAQETRLYNPPEGKTFPMRSKERAHDYRYFPEPDLLPLIVNAKWQAEIEARMPELPDALRRRLVEQYGVTEDDAQTLSVSQARAAWFEEAAKKAKNPKRVANLILTELLGRLRGRNLELEQSPISIDGVVMSADLVEAGTISSKMLKDLYDKSFERGEDFPAVYKKEKPQQISDTAELERIIDEVIAGNPKQLEQYRGGKTTVIAYFVGQVMKASKGKANPTLVNELLPKKLQG
jgi:aspartyl-tRNA(Asn)/glutamyl-tRNA(Gln) amidotransferase subunit B